MVRRRTIGSFIARQRHGQNSQGRDAPNDDDYNDFDVQRAARRHHPNGNCHNRYHDDDPTQESEIHDSSRQEASGPEKFRPLGRFRSLPLYR